MSPKIVCLQKDIQNQDGGICEATTGVLHQVSCVNLAHVREFMCQIPSGIQSTISECYSLIGPLAGVIVQQEIKTLYFNRLGDLDVSLEVQKINKVCWYS